MRQVQAGDDHGTTLSRLPDWVRWVLVVPSAIAGFLLIQFLVSPSVPTRTPDWPYQLINSFASGLVFVRAAAWMAPRANVVVAIVGAVIVTIFTTIIGVFSMTQPNPGFHLFAGALTLLGGVAACVQIYNEEKVIS